MVPEDAEGLQAGSASIESTELLFGTPPWIRGYAPYDEGISPQLPRFTSTPTRPVGLTICRIERPRLYFGQL